jgi:uncharacterized NAD(P)/FAD-binding protein YdhS
MIFDGADKFPGSCVEYTRFRYFPLRERFAKLREQEFWLQDALSRVERENLEKWEQVWRDVRRSIWYPALRTKFFLEFTEGELCWMAHNVAEEFKDFDPVKRRKRGKKEAVKSKQLSFLGEK